MAPFRQAARVSSPGVVAPAVIKRFRTPDDLLAFDSGRLEVITLGGELVAKGSYAPGWRWSRCAPQASASERNHGAHAGVVLAGCAVLRTDTGKEVELASGDVFNAPITGSYDLWVVGERPCEILYLSGVETLLARLRAG